jgi:hypothetical protein
LAYFAKDLHVLDIVALLSPDWKVQVGACAQSNHELWKKQSRRVSPDRANRIHAKD